jgi:predicted metal-binding membrane protein
MGMGSLPSFALTWAAMTAAVMSPSTLPFVVSFARRARRWPLGSVVLVAAYLLGCVACSGGVMVALMVLGMTNVL